MLQVRGRCSLKLECGVLPVRGRCFSEKKSADYYIHVILTPLFRELKEEEEIKETYLFSKNSKRFVRQKLLIFEVKISLSIKKYLQELRACLSPGTRKFETVL